MNTPRKPANVCAVGAVDPTFYRQDGRKYAAEAARGELARTIQVHVSAVMYDEQSTTGRDIEQSFVTSVVTSISEVVIAGAEISAYWYDATGAVSRQGMTYALACMRTDQSVAELAAKLEEAYPDEDDREKIAGVKERADRLFDELEAEEQKRSEGAESGEPSGPAPESE